MTGLIIFFQKPFPISVTSPPQAWRWALCLGPATYLVHDLIMALTILCERAVLVADGVRGDFTYLKYEHQILFTFICSACHPMPDPWLVLKK